MNHRFLIRFLVLLASLCSLAHAADISSPDLFDHGTKAYTDGDFENAASCFIASAASAPSSSTWHNLGDAEWQLNRTGPAVLAWERALWLNPYNTNSHSNLRFARKAKLLDSPELTWYEICSTWLPVNLWPWLATLSLWTSITLMVLPGTFRWRKKGWHQAIAAAGFAVFLLTIPALIGIESRAKIGVVLNRNTSLRLTPTIEGQPVAHLAAGEMVRLEKLRGNYLYVRTALGMGWIKHGEVGLISD